ncbi:MAG: NAD(P)-dependent oxidoreductase [Nanoarchaeota archaeon]|nr:NAD(P)-dependent oxidoreductase [Nanoarchaeota archaeon]
MKKRKILVTGANGFLAGTTIKQLSQKGYGVVATSIEEKPLRRLPVGVEYIQADLTSKHSMRELFKGRRIDDLIHHAALFSLSAPEDLLHKVNVGGTANLLYAAICEGVERAVITSSGTVYAKKNEKWVEEDPLGPVEPYGQSKLKQEMISQVLAYGPRMEIAFIRPAVILGKESRYGGAVAMFTHYLMQSLFQGMTAVPNDGNDGLCFVHVDDCAAMHVHLLENNLTQKIENLKRSKDSSYEDFETFNAFNAVDVRFDISDESDERALTNNDLADIVLEQLNLPWYRSLLKGKKLSLPEKPLKFLSRYNDKAINWLKENDFPVPTISLDGGSVDLMYAGDVSMSAGKILATGFMHKYPYSKEWIAQLVKENVNENWQKLLGSYFSRMAKIL